MKPAVAGVVAALALTAVACDTTEVPVDGRSIAHAVTRGAPPSLAELPRATAAPAAGDDLGSGKPVTFAFGGDVNFEGAPATLLAEDPAALLDGVADALVADVTMLNLETALTERGRAVSKEFNFRAPAAALAVLRRAGVDVVTLANNHGMDFGEEGLLDTLTAADDPTSGLPLVGAGHDEAAAYAAFRLRVRGQRISILGASRVTDGHLVGPWAATEDGPGLAVAEDPTRLLEAVRAERREADTLVVYLHWGRERVECPIDDQPHIADALIDAGADVVVGSHAHLPLGGGLREGAYVHYGLGNFVFGSAVGPSAQSGVLHLTLTGRRIDAAEWVPVRLSSGVPATLTGVEAADAVAAWNDLRACADLEPGVERSSGSRG